MAKYFIFCGHGFLFGGMAGSILGAVVGGSVCLASPIILGLVAYRSVKYLK